MSKENIATPSGILGTTAKFFRLMENEGVTLKDFQQIIDDKSARKNLGDFIKKNRLDFKTESNSNSDTIPPGVLKLMNSGPKIFNSGGFLKSGGWYGD